MQKKKRDRVNRILIEMIKSMMMTGRKEGTGEREQVVERLLSMGLTSAQLQEAMVGQQRNSGVSGASFGCLSSDSADKKHH